MKLFFKSHVMFSFHDCSVYLMGRIHSFSCSQRKHWRGVSSHRPGHKGLNVSRRTIISLGSRSLLIVTFYDPSFPSWALKWCACSLTEPAVLSPEDSTVLIAWLAAAGGVIRSQMSSRSVHWNFSSRVQRNEIDPSHCIIWFWSKLINSVGQTGKIGENVFFFFFNLYLNTKNWMANSWHPHTVLYILLTILSNFK